MKLEGPFERKIGRPDDLGRNVGRRNLPGAPGFLDQVPLASNPNELAGPDPARELDPDLGQALGKNLEHGRMEERHGLEPPQ